MDYVTDGVINEYSTKFPYRLAENISRLRFTWSSSDRMVREFKKYSECYQIYQRRVIHSKVIGNGA